MNGSFHQSGVDFCAAPNVCEPNELIGESDFWRQKRTRLYFRSIGHERATATRQWWPGFVRHSRLSPRHFWRQKRDRSSHKSKLSASAHTHTTNMTHSLLNVTRHTSQTVPHDPPPGHDNPSFKTSRISHVRANPTLICSPVTLRVLGVQFLAPKTRTRSAPAICVAAAQLVTQSFAIDGESVRAWG